jgi:opacity protein-like surface antigen
MNIKNVALLSILLPGSVMAAQGPFTGFYGALDMGFMQSEVEDVYNTNIGVTGALNLNLRANPAKVTDTSFLGGVSFGYALFVDPMFVFALEARAHFEDLKSIVNHEHVEANSNFLAVTNTSIELDHDFALLGKLGMVLDGKCFMYVLGGADWGKIDINSNSTYRQNLGPSLTADVGAEQSSYETGYLLGLGIDYLVLDYLSVGLEYNYTVFGELEFVSPISGLVSANGIPLPGSYIASFNEITMNVSKVLLKFNYYFC